ncbi:MAG: TonB-dependent receptor [Acidobacteriota bacterium]
MRRNPAGPSFHSSFQEEGSVRSRRLHWILAVGLLGWALLGSGAAFGQISGSVEGVVRDVDGAPIPGATVMLAGEALQRAGLVAITDSSGSYRLRPIPAGVYDLTVELSGFATAVREGFTVGVNATLTLDWTLQLAAVSETIAVTGDAPLLEITRSEMASRVAAEAIENLPLNGRNVEDLVSLVPGVKPNPAGVADQQFSIFGERAAATSFVVDGGDNNDPLDGGAFQRFAQDSIQEFEVITNGYEAEFGRAQGGVVNVVTRSGTNTLRGSAFYFVRNDSWDSSNVSGQEVPELERDQYGASLGGAFVPDRLFFFGSTELLDEQRGRNLNFSQVPDWVQRGLATPGGVENFDLGPEDDGFTALGKLDYLPRENSRWSLGYNRTDDEAAGEIPAGIAGSIVMPSGARTQDREADSLQLRQTWLPNGDAFLESQLKWLDGSTGSNLDRTDRGETALLLLRSGFIQTGAPVGGRSLRDIERLQLSQSLTLLRDGWKGRHEFKFGWEYIDTTLDGFDEVWNDVEYSAAFLDPNAADVMEDLFNRFGFEQSAARFFTLSANPDGRLLLDVSNEDIAVFAQDKWAISDNVTLDLGIRYDRASLFGDDDDNISPRFGIAWDLGGRHRTIVKASAGLFYDRNALTAAAGVPEKGGIFTRNAFDVALPRLGAEYTDSLIDLVITSGFPIGGGARTPAENPAYLPFADALRSDPLALYGILGIAVADPSNPPVVTADNIEALSGLSPQQALDRLETLWPGTDWEFFDVPGGSIVGDRVLSFFPRGPLDFNRTISVFDRDATPQTFSWTVGVEHQINDRLTGAVAYIHRETDDLLTRRIVNLFDVPPGDPNFGRTTDGGAFVSQVGYDGFIDYDGVVLSLRRPFHGRYGFMISYTYSDAEDNLLNGDVGSTFSNNNRPELDIGESNLAAPHVVVGNVTTLLPWNVRLSAIAFFRDGNAFSPRGIVDTDGDGLVDQRDLSVPRNAFRVDDFLSVDLRLEKPVTLPGGHEINVLIDAFNVTNEDNVANVNTVSGPDFGMPNEFFPGREIQIGVRFYLGGR